VALAELVVHGEDSETTGIRALSTAEGATRWQRHDLGDPETVAGVGDSLLVGGSREDDGFVAALDPATGEPRWRLDVGRPVTTLAPVDRTVFARTAGGQVAAIR
jgi:outer membrane protein assembly factor BamB